MKEIVTLESIKNNNFDVNELADNIYLINNFLSNEEIDRVLAIINNLKEEDWHLQNEGVSHNFMNKFYDHNDFELQQTICQRINRICTESPDKIEISGYRRILRQPVGEHMDAHVDEVNDSRNFTREYAVVIYINDDYEGGELVFLNKQITIKPSKSAAMVFKTGPDYLHQVNKVIGNNVRYCMPGFIFSTES